MLRSTVGIKRCIRSFTNYYNYFPKTLKAGPPPKGPFDIDTRALRLEYLKAQQLAHPDVAAQQNEKPLASSAELGIAYRTLCNPLLRAEHILALNGKTSLEEGHTVQDEDLLMDIMMKREEVAETEDKETLKKLANANDERLAKAQSDARTAFEANDLEAAQNATIVMSYWTKLKKELEEKLN